MKFISLGEGLHQKSQHWVSEDRKITGYTYGGGEGTFTATFTSVLAEGRGYGATELEALQDAETSYREIVRALLAHAQSDEVLTLENKQ